MQTKGRDIWIIFPVFCALIGYLIWAHRAEPWSRCASPRVQIVFGFAFWTLARIQLGASFSVQAKLRRWWRTDFIRGFGIDFMFFGSVMNAGMLLFSFETERPSNICGNHSDANYSSAKKNPQYWKQPSRRLSGLQIEDLVLGIRA